MTMSRGDLESALGGKNFLDASANDIESAFAMNPYGAVEGLVSSLELGKKSLMDGEITVRDYMDYAEEVAPKLNHVFNTITTWGGAWSPVWNFRGRMMKFYDTGSGGKKGQGEFFDINFEDAFSRRELAKIPESSLPTREEVDSGAVDLTYFPPGMKMRPEPKIEEPPIVEPPLPDDQELIQTPTPLPVTPGPGVITPDPTVELPEEAGIGSLIGDPLRLEAALQDYQKQIEDFGRRQEEQVRQMFQVQQQQRESRLGELGQFLAGEEQRRFEEMQPGIQEKLNTQGLLRSSALGESFARERSKLEADTQAALLSQGLSDREADIAATGQILEPRLSAQQAGFERYFSLQDLEREQNLARELAAAGVPYTGSSGGMSTGEGIFQGALSGAAAGSVVPGWGNLIGGVLGAVGGGLTADDK